MGTIVDIEPLSSALFGKTRRAVLALLLGHPDRAFYLREIVRATRAGQGAIQRELERLEHAGIVVRSTLGQQVFFKANPKCPIFGELKSIVIKTAGAAEVLRASLEPLADRIVVAFIFGSVARGAHRESSDLDVCVVGDVSFAETVSYLTAAQNELAREVNPTVYPRTEFTTKLADGHYFVSNLVGGPKVFVIGDEHELAGLAEKRVADPPPDHPRGNRGPSGHRASGSG